MIAEVGAVFHYISQPVEVEVDGVPFFLRPIGRDVLEASNVVATAIAESMGKSYRWGTGFMFGNLELAMELWITISGISGFDDE